MEEEKKVFPYNDEAPTHWLKTNRPDLSFFVYRRTRKKRDGMIWDFECSFGGRSRSTKSNTKKTKFNCTATLKVEISGNEGRIFDENFIHMHPTNDEFLYAWNRHDAATIAEIRKRTEHGE